MNEINLAPCHPDVPRPSNDKLVELAQDVINAIEMCGASPALTAAVSLAFDLKVFLCKTDAAKQEALPVTAKVLTEHNGCGHGTQVDQLTVRLNPGDKVMLVMGPYSAAVAKSQALG